MVSAGLAPAAFHRLKQNAANAGAKLADASS
jgi:hypothetical protein